MAVFTPWASAFVQAVVFLLLPFVWWLARARRSAGFLAWLGWVRPRTDKPVLLWCGLAALYLVFLTGGLLIARGISSGVATSQFHGLGWAGLWAVLPYALIQTGFAEESLFRGFLLKRLAARIGFRWANDVQALVFGVLHALPVSLAFGPVWGLPLGLLTMAVGASMGWLNERMAGGSIVPGWLLHAAANLTTGCLALVGVL